MSPNSALAPMLDRLASWAPLDESDRAKVLALPHFVRKLRTHSFIAREGDKPRHSCLLLSGFAYRHKIAGNGGRQIFSIHMKGDIVDLHNALPPTVDHNVEALTDLEAALIPVEAIQEIAASRPAIGKALWCETLVDAAIFREWTLNIGRRDARTRMAHLLCEFALRLEAAGLGEQGDYELPMTQQELADALALTAVHINRTLKSLAADGLIVRTGRSIRIEDWHALAEAGDFDGKYLHLEREAPAIR